MVTAMIQIGLNALPRARGNKNLLLFCNRWLPPKSIHCNATIVTAIYSFCRPWIWACSPEMI